MATRKLSVKIENKLFTVGFDQRSRGRVVQILETHQQRHYVIKVEEVVTVWIIDSISDLLLAPQTQKFFRKTNCSNGFFWIQKSSNKRGHVIEITKVLNAGGKNNIVVPSGSNFKGWSTFCGLLLDFINRKTQHQNASSSHTVRKGTTFAEIVRPSPSLSSNTPPGTPILNEVRKISWKEVIVGTKRDFHDDWSRILGAFEEQLQEQFIINPFQADKALLKCPSEITACLLITNVGWVTFGSFTLKVEAWDALKHGKISVVLSYGGWIRFRNIPLHLWSLKLFRDIGNCFGGFIEYSDNNSALIECLEVAIKVSPSFCRARQAKLVFRG